MTDLSRNLAQLDGARPVVEIGPGASAAGKHAADVARGPRPSSRAGLVFRLVFCRRSECKGHTDERRCGDDA